jgi:superfamily II DNA or RNA helicase
LLGESGARDVAAFLRAVIEQHPYKYAWPIEGYNGDVCQFNLWEWRQRLEAVYGPRFHQLSFKEAIHANPPIISDYKIVTYSVTDEEIEALIEDNRLLTDADAELEEEEARSLAAGIALRDAFAKHGIKHAISFHRSIDLASRFADQQQSLTDKGILPPPIECSHISSKKSAGDRATLLLDFEKSSCALMTNARCLTEGIDIPAIDCVLFADPKQSTTLCKPLAERCGPTRARAMAISCSQSSFPAG